MPLSRLAPPAQRTARRITYRIQTNDVRMYLFNDTVHRTERAIARAGGKQLGGVLGLPRHIKRWVVLRSPHVNKTSREKFWMVTHRRILRWEAGPNVDTHAAMEIPRKLPATVAMRIQEEVPGVQTLRAVFDTIQLTAKSKSTGLAAAVDNDTNDQSEANKDNADDDSSASQTEGKNINGVDKDNIRLGDDVDKRS